MVSLFRGRFKITARKKKEMKRNKKNKRRANGSYLKYRIGATVSITLSGLRTETDILYLQSKIWKFKIRSLYSISEILIRKHVLLSLILYPVQWPIRFTILHLFPQRKLPYYTKTWSLSGLVFQSWIFELTCQAL